MNPIRHIWRQLRRGFSVSVTAKGSAYMGTSLLINRAIWKSILFRVLAKIVPAKRLWKTLSRIITSKSAT